MKLLFSIVVATLFALLPLLFAPPEIEINHVTCKIVNHTFESNCITGPGLDVYPCWVKGIKLIYEDKETNWQIREINWNQIKDEVNCYYLSLFPNILKYGDTPSFIESNPILINIGISIIIWISIFTYILLNCKFKNF